MTRKQHFLAKINRQVPYKNYHTPDRKMWLLTAGEHWSEYGNPSNIKTSDELAAYCVEVEANENGLR